MKNLSGRGGASEREIIILIILNFLKCCPSEGKKLIKKDKGNEGRRRRERQMKGS